MNQLPKFVYLISVKHPPSSQNANSAKNRIKRATNPFSSVENYNRSLPREEQWEIQLIIGPFRKHSTEFRVQWQKKSRKLYSRITFGCRAAEQLRKTKGIPLRIFSARPYQTLKLLRRIP
jgi:hypothetical protein